MAVQYRCHVIQTEITWPVYSTAIGWSSGDVIRTICNNVFNYIFWKFKIKIKTIIGANLRFSGSCGISSFSDWLRICFLLNTTTFILNWIYMNFRINLTQFYINFSRQEHQIDVFLYHLTPEILRFYPIPSFHFLLQFL